ncbi:MAG: response regulator transcription factor [Oscillospiraceae bacterium]|jgi:two-component system response regulator ArlR|nr:response regulator transcription factor [Oscillospiraceae bacterium]
MRILIVEDERLLAETLADILTQAHYIVDVSYDGESGLDNARSGIYDAVVLDVMLPKLDGFAVLRRLREERNAAPVLLLTARGGLHDRVYGLRQGADYYLTKPFENAELLACLEAITRRQREIVPETLRFGDLELTPSACRLQRGEAVLSLNAKETEILRLLMRNSGQYLPKETLLTKVWGFESGAVDNNVEAYISFLRKKLALLQSKVSLRVQRNVGYRLEEDL